MPAESAAKSAAAQDLDQTTALLLRAIATELAQRIIPELKSADAIERANFSRLVLLNLAGDLDLLPALAARAVPALRTSLQQPPDGAAPDQAEVAALRELAARTLRTLADRGDADSFAQLEPLGRWDARWVLDYDAATAARNAPTLQSSSAGSSAAVGGETVTMGSVTAYLRRRFPQEPDLRATEVVPIPGGRSKKTFFVTVAGSATLPPQLVIRQDYALKYAGTKVADEYPPLVALAARGLPVPRPLHLERDASELGPPFMFVNRLTGRPPGTYFGMQTTCPGAFRDLARFLAETHQLAPESLGYAAPAAPRDNLRALLDQYRSKWRENATRSSPVVDYAYAWAERECARDSGTTTFVHGDAGPYNFLVDQDRLTAVLDWEFAHVGDPAEDLGVARIYAEGSLPWDEFMQIYQAAGGKPVSESRIRLGMLVQFLKGTTLVAASGRNFREGGTTEFIKGANAFTGLRLIELRIAQMLDRFGAV